MNLLIYPVPLFDENTAVQAYYLKNRRGNEILDGSGTAIYDGAMISPPLEMLNIVGLEALTMGKPIFIPVTRYMLLGRLEIQSKQPADKLFFLINANEISDASQYIQNIIRLKKLGYSFAVQMINNYERIKPLLAYCTFVFYDVRVSGDVKEEEIRSKIYHDFPNLKITYTHIESKEAFDELKCSKNCYYQGTFYRLPVTKGKHTVEPFQTHLINLLNIVSKPDIDFKEVANIVEKDPAMAVSLLKMVNSVHFALKEKVKSINQAVIMLGQKEISKWITTAATRQLGVKKPGELTRLALVRARFAEEIGNKFGFKEYSDTIFLIGLFSVLDAMLDMPIEEAFKIVNVSEDIRDALVGKGGRFSFIYQFVLEYEAAHWSNVSRMMILHDVNTSDVYEAYSNAMIWYNTLLSER